MSNVWPVVPLGEICAFQNGGTPSRAMPEYFDGDIPWLTGADITEPVVTHGRTFVSEAGIKASPAAVVPPGTVLLVTRTGVGKVAVAGTALSFSQDITALHPDPSRVDRKYLVHFLQTQAANLKRQARGATILGVTRETVARTPIPLPPMEEQRRIAAVLDQADELRAKRQACLALIDSLNESVFFGMFGDCASGETVALGAVTQLITKGTTPTSVGLEFAQSGVPFLRVQDLSDEVVDPNHVEKFISPDSHRSLRRSVVRPDDVLLSIAGTVGRSALVPPDAPEMNCNQAVALIRCGAALRPGYLAAWLKTGDALRQVAAAKVTATISNLSLGVISRLLLPVPPIEEQLEFERRVAQARAIRQTGRTATRSVDLLFATLQHRAFAGQL